jgi:hypothetical protein
VHVRFHRSSKGIVIMLKKSAVTRAFVVAAAVLLAGTPMAYADPQDGSQQCPDQQGTNGQGPDQQCPGQGNPAGKIIDKVNDGADQAQKGLQQQQQQDPRNKPISQVGFMYLVNGVPTCFHNWDVGVPGMVAIMPAQAC